MRLRARWLAYTIKYTIVIYKNDELLEARRARLQGMPT